MQEIKDIVQGCLLGDGSIRAQNNKYFSFKVISKDKMFVEWIKILSNVREIGSLLRKRRLELGLSQNQLAKKIGIRRENIRDVELGKRNFGVENLRKVLNALKINPKYLLEKMNENEGKI
jgi:ribosome-binding protein aMBF1 (putative translation factor)